MRHAMVVAAGEERDRAIRAHAGKLTRDTRAKVLSVTGRRKALAIECVETADAGFFNEYPAELVAAPLRTVN